MKFLFLIYKELNYKPLSFDSTFPWNKLHLQKTVTEFFSQWKDETIGQTILQKKLIEEDFLLAGQAQLQFWLLCANTWKKFFLCLLNIWFSKDFIYIKIIYIKYILNIFYIKISYIQGVPKKKRRSFLNICLKSAL